MSDSPTSSIRPVWIASYPRSGNTFVRIIFQNLFHLPTYSLYRVEGQEFKDPSADALDEAPFLARNWQSRVVKNGEGTLMLIKTHDLPQDDADAIYIVRDGRASIDSYFHYHKKFAFEQPSLTEIIAGACQFGSWSAHYAAWHPQTRPRTLFLKYEELVANPEAAIASISTFLKLAPQQGRLPTFEELKARWPAFFRRGRNEDFLTQWTPGQIALFNALHGPAMQELGYPLTPGSEVGEGPVRELALSASRLHQLYLEELNKQGGFIATREALSARVDQLSGELSLVQRNRWVKVGAALGLVKAPNLDAAGSAEPPGQALP